MEAVRGLGGLSNEVELLNGMKSGLSLVALPKWFVNYIVAIQCREAYAYLFDSLCHLI
jgi:hypothetical protein